MSKNLMTNPKPRVLVVGLARNLEKTLEKTIHQIVSTFNPLFAIDFYVVESDSGKAMHNVLEEIAKGIPNFHYKSLGNLCDIIPDRVERIRFCRNVYVAYIRENMENKNWDFVVVADLDGINRKLKTKNLIPLLDISDKWEVLTCNQSAPYYDIYALRARGWVEFDCISESRARTKSLEDELTQIHRQATIKRRIIYRKIRNIRKELIYDKMVRIPPTGRPIIVDSAFGGIAFYRAQIFMKHDYSRSSKTEFECEHVTLHRKIREQHGTILILPSFINGGWNEHSLNKIPLVRFARRVKKTLKPL